MLLFHAYLIYSPFPATPFCNMIRLNILLRIPSFQLAKRYEIGTDKTHARANRSFPTTTTTFQPFYK